MGQLYQSLYILLSVKGMFCIQKLSCIYADSIFYSSHSSALKSTVQDMLFEM